MSRVFYLDRSSKKVEEEKVYGLPFLKMLYSSRKLSFLSSKILLSFIAKTPLVSRLYGHMQKKAKSRHKIAPFVVKYQIKMEDFIEPQGGFKSFNDFFIRQLNCNARAINREKNIAIMPADGRYMVFADISKMDTFFVKGQKLSLAELLKDKQLVEKYEGGSLVFARLCPTDYHRFHFPFDCIPSEPYLINGYLYSVNPMALRKNIRILSENKRMLTELKSEEFGDVLFIEVGATSVGSIHETYTPCAPHAKGDEKGFFEFGGSSILLIFQKDKIIFDSDLLEASSQRLEVKALMGESLGKSRSEFR